MSRDLKDHSERESRIREKLAQVMRFFESGKYQSAAVEFVSAMSGFGGMRRDYGFEGEIYRMQRETLAITLANDDGKVFRKLSSGQQDAYRAAAEKIGTGL